MKWQGDDMSWSCALPFDFPFYGVYYGTIYISSNGLITFLGPDNSLSNGIPALAERLAIAPAWDDWVSYDPYDIYMWQNTTHVGIRWCVRHFGSEVEANFEAILCINGVIQFNYGYSNGTVSTTLGISNGYNDVLAEDTIDLNYFASVVFTPPLAEHELIVSVEAPNRIQPGESALLNATVFNFGQSDETNVTLQLLLNGTPAGSASIPDLSLGGSFTSSYL
jgi:hypothetical protein